MTVAGIQDTLFFCSMEKAEYTSQLSTIMLRLTTASSKNLELMKSTTGLKQALYDKVQTDPEYADSYEYRVDSDKIQDDYEIQLADINNWETQLQQEKTTTETRLKEVDTLQEGWTARMKNNIKNEFTYGGGGGK